MENYLESYQSSEFLENLNNILKSLHTLNIIRFKKVLTSQDDFLKKICYL